MTFQKLAQNNPQFSFYESAFALETGKRRSERFDRNVFWKKISHHREVLCVYGFDETLFPLAKKWFLEAKKGEERFFIFIEDEIFSLKFFLEHSSLREELLSHPQVKIYFLDNFFQIPSLCKQIALDFSLLNIEVAALPSYAKVKEKNFQKIKESMGSFCSQTKLSLLNYGDFGILEMETMYENLLQNFSFYPVEKLKDAFKGVPAIILGAGPSLEQELEILKKIQERALFFSGGSALKILSKKNIPVQFIGNIDCKTPIERFQNCFLKEKAFFHPLGGVSKELSSAIQTPRILADLGAFWERWMFEEMGFSPGMIDGGWTIGTAMTSFAAMMGCSPILLVGFDFSTANREKKYAAGVKMSSREKRTILWKETQDVFGNIVFAQEDWIYAAKWLSDFVKKCPSQKFLNATKGGLSIENISRVSLKESVSLFKKSLDESMFAYLKKIPEETFDRKKVMSFLDKLEKSFDSCKRKIQEAHEEFLLAEKEGKKSFWNRDFLQGELVYEKILQPIFDPWAPLFKRKTKSLFQSISEANQVLAHELFLLKEILWKHADLLKSVKKERL